MRKVFQQSMGSLLCLCLLSACGTASTPSASNASGSGGCSAAGKTHPMYASAPAAQGDWPMFRGDLRRDGAATAGGSRLLTLAWSYCVGAATLSSPAVSAGVVYIASTNAILAALDARSGHVLWQFRAGGAFYSSPSVQNGVVYIGALDGFVYAVDAASGRLRWRSQVDSVGAKIWSSPAVSNGLVIIGVASTLSEKPKIPGEVLAFDTVTGARRWRTWSEPGGAPGGGIWSSPAIDVARGIVYVGIGDPDDGAEALDLRDGHMLWHWRSVVHDVADTDVGSGPLLYSDSRGQPRIAVGGKDGSLYSLDAQNGQVLWHTHIGDHVFSSPAFADGTLYVIAVLGRRSVSWAVDAETGALHWQRAIPVIVYGSPAIVGQTLYISIGDAFGPGDGGVEVLDAATGDQVQYADLHSAVTSSPAVLPSWLYVGAYDGNVYAFVR
jgi:eukaryotic-like serine/threonine-protein kinase